MRCFVTGVDGQGRSCVISQREVAFADVAPGLSLDTLFRTTESPPAPRLEGRADLVDLAVGPGLCSWSLWHFEAGSEVRMHHSDTVDFDVILDGSIDLILDDGAHVLRAGDCVVVTGIDHAWSAGANGCITAALALGTPPRE